MTRRPGFFTPIGVVAAAVLLVVVLGWTLAAGGALFSPGELNAQTKGASLGGAASHAALAGDCGACHPAPWSSQTLADRCLGCHDDVAGEIERREGLHGRLVAAGAPAGKLSSDCRDCHPEHNGPQGALTELDAADFPHDATGFSLSTHQRTEGGRPFACGDCHDDGYPVFDDAICTDCHAGIDVAFMERHEATYGATCLACHDGSGRDGAGFDHGTTGFALTGGHADAACVDCHEGARSRRDLEQAPRDCYGCHAEDDKHDGAYGRQCGECHGTGDWEDVTFDHSAFPLDHGSEERTAGCATCHPATTSAYTCYGCHEHTTATVLDEHEGRSLTALEDCIRCHPGGREADEGGGD